MRHEFGESKHSRFYFSTEITFTTFFILFLFLSLFPFIDEYTLGLHNHQRLVQVLFICSTNIFLSYKLKFKNRHFIIALMICTLYSLVYKHISNHLFIFFYLNLYILFINLSHVTLDIEKLAKILCYTNILICLLCLPNIFIQIYSNAKLTAFDTYYGFYNIRHFNQFQIATIPFLIYLSFTAKNKAFFTSFVIFNLFLMYLGTARGALVCYFLILLFMFFNHKKNTTLLFFISIITLIISDMSYNYQDEIIKKTLDLTEVTQGRNDTWRDAFHAITSSWNSFTFGFGPGSYLEYDYHIGHPHNIFIYIFYDFGIVGLTAIIYWAATGLKNKELLKDISNSNLLLIFLIVNFTLSLVSGTYIMPIPQTVLIIILSQYFSRKIINYNVTTRHVLANISLSILATFLLFYFTILSLSCDSDEAFGPKFWVNGNICNQSKEVNLDKRYE